jgi:hypothetical protein
VPEGRRRTKAGPAATAGDRRGSRDGPTRARRHRALRPRHQGEQLDRLVTAAGYRLTVLPTSARSAADWADAPTRVVVGLGPRPLDPDVLAALRHRGFSGGHVRRRIRARPDAAFRPSPALVSGGRSSGGDPWSATTGPGPPRRPRCGTRPVGSRSSPLDPGRHPRWFGHRCQSVDRGPTHRPPDRNRRPRGR